jgi:hypothetical protein
MDIRRKHKRNGNLFDSWSIVHLCTGITFGWLMNPFAAMVLMTLWEPFEIIILSPLLAKRGIIFGYESLRNSLSDIVFNTTGILIGLAVLRVLISPPFLLF